MKRAIWIAGLAAALVAGYFGQTYFAERRTPPGQAALAQFDASAFGQAFDAAANETRVVALLSPT